MRYSLTLVLIPIMFLAAAITVSADETLMMRFPDIYKDQIVFSYGGDIWISNLNETPARQLTSGDGFELFAKFSPDGQWIAYTGQYHGYNQVYVIPVQGGEPRQLTFYPAQGTSDHQVLDWTPDGQSIVFLSRHDHFGYGRLFKINKNGGWPEPLPFIEGSNISYSPDGKKLALNRIYNDFATWKRYRGGQQQDIWVYDFTTDKMEKITTWEGNDRAPIWYKDSIYYLSDPNGRMNFYKYNTLTQEIKPITDYKDWDIRWPGYSSNSIIFEKGGRLYMMNLADEKITDIKVNVSYDRSQLKPEYINTVESIQDASIANGGKRFTVTARGELFTVPAEKGDVKNLSNTPGVKEIGASWSPDNKWIAFISDETGTEEIYLIDVNGKNKTQLTKDSKNIIFTFAWSPDSKMIAYSDASNTLYYINIETKAITPVDTAKQSIPVDFNWSPDSGWIAFSKTEDNLFASIYLYNLEKKSLHQVTKDIFNNYSPVFDPSGKYLYFISMRDFSPTLGNFELSYVYYNMDRVYVANLKKDTPAPFAPQSDEVEAKAAPGSQAPTVPSKGKEEADAKKPADQQLKIEIDLDGLENRIAALPVPSSTISGLRAGDGVIFYMKRAGAPEINLFGGPDFSRSLVAFDLKSRKETPLLSGLRFYDLSQDGKTILWTTMNQYGIAPAGPQPINPAMGKPMNALKLETLKDPQAEWKQMLREAWRLEKNFFYVRNMHGVNWDEIYKQYQTLLPYLSNRLDLTYLMGEMIAELATSHTYVGGGDLPVVPNTQIGLLGCRFEPDKDGYFKIKKIFKGENWDRAYRSPLTETGTKASEGDYILEINGKKLRVPENPYYLLEMTLGKTVTLKLNKKPVEAGAWTTDVMPIGNEQNLIYIDWVEANRLRVEKATNGKIGYVHIPDMMFTGLNRFAKMWYSQLKKEGIIVDERFNRGGFVSLMILERMRREIASMNGGRIEGSDTYPVSAFSGHLVMLINCYAGSDGDYFPYWFKHYGLGPLIGTRTWGGIVGIFGFTQLLDGGFVTVPAATDYTLDGKWFIENHGVDPDIEVDNLPPDEFKGKDAQLDKAIEIIMGKVVKEPVKQVPLPKDPNKAK